MDQRQIGAFIAQLRRERGWTQEELGERLGVTNKTVSRWENGNYMPSIEMLALLGRTFGVSLNELVQGRRLEAEDSFRAAAEENLTSALERPGARLLRWLDRHMLTMVVTLLLGLFLATALGLYWNYKTDHPADVSLFGTYAFAPTDLERNQYLVFSREGEFYRYHQYEPIREEGTYTMEGDRVTVTVAGGDSYQLLLKADTLYEWDEAGNLIGYTKCHDYPIFFYSGPGTVPGEWEELHEKEDGF